MLGLGVVFFWFLGFREALFAAAGPNLAGGRPFESSFTAPRFPFRKLATGGKKRNDELHQRNHI